MAAPVMGDDSISLPDEVEHLSVPVIGAQRPAMMEDDGLRVLGSPVLVEDRHAIIRRHRAHVSLLRSSCVRAHRCALTPAVDDAIVRARQRHRTTDTPGSDVWPADHTIGY